MTNNKPVQRRLDIQLELFQSTRQLNLSKTYEAIPKEVAHNDPAIHWQTKTIAGIVEKPFFVDDTPYIAAITPAMIRNPKTRESESRFSGIREVRVEYAIISIAAKETLNVNTDANNQHAFFLRTSLYRIQKEIVDATNQQEGKCLKVNDCPYNTTAIREALDILKGTQISVREQADSKKALYTFNRIKDMYTDNQKVVIELGSMVNRYIASGEWHAVDGASILATRSVYALRAKVLLNTRFRYAAANGKPYSIALSRAVLELQLIENQPRRITLQKVVKIFNDLVEVDHVVVDKKFEGRKLVDAVLHIYPTTVFASRMIQNNTLTKRTQQPVLQHDGSLLLKPLKTDFSNNTDYYTAKSHYQRLTNTISA